MERYEENVLGMHLTQVPNFMTHGRLQVANISSCDLTWDRCIPGENVDKVLKLKSKRLTNVKTPCQTIGKLKSCEVVPYGVVYFKKKNPTKHWSNIYNYWLNSIIKVPFAVLFPLPKSIAASLAPARYTLPTLVVVIPIPKNNC